MTTTTTFHCNCGESYSRLGLAIDCRKCVRYLMDEDYPRRTVIVVQDARAPQIVWRAWEADWRNQQSYRRHVYGD